jgi:hypothetical protein
MALLWVESGDHYDDPIKNYNTANNVAIESGQGYKGTDCLRLPNGSSLSKTLDADYGTLVVGVRFQQPSGTSGLSGTFVSFSSHGSTQVSTVIMADGTIQVRRGGSGTVLGTTALALTTDTWHYIEIKILFNNGAGTAGVWIDGINALSLTGQNTLGTGITDTNANSITINGASNTGRLIDDFYIDSSTVHGDSRAESLLPDSDGFYQEWDPSVGGSHYVLVDENPPSMTDRVTTLVAGERDSYGFENVSFTSAAIKGIQVCVYADKDDGGVRTICAFLRIGGTDYDGATQGLASTERYYTWIWETNPATGVAWTKADLNAIEAGVKLVA